MDTTSLSLSPPFLFLHFCLSLLNILLVHVWCLLRSNVCCTCVHAETRGLYQVSDFIPRPPPKPGGSQSSKINWPASLAPLLNSGAGDPKSGPHASMTSTLSMLPPPDSVLSLWTLLTSSLSSLLPHTSFTPPDELVGMGKGTQLLTSADL